MPPSRCGRNYQAHDIVSPTGPRSHRLVQFEQTGEAVSGSTDRRAGLTESERAEANRLLRIVRTRLSAEPNPARNEPALDVGGVESLGALEP